MNGQERRDELVKKLRECDKPFPGDHLAKELGVSRQIIVQDIALIRANGIDIMSTHRGYVIHSPKTCTRVFKVIHTEDQVEEELNLYVDMGGKVEDVFVFHKIHGVIRVDLKIRSRVDVRRYMQGISEGKSTQLMKLTSNYHYHTITAESEEILDMIREELDRKGFLAQLQDYEPVDCLN